jgi:hypothetical protein
MLRNRPGSLIAKINKTHDIGYESSGTDMDNTEFILDNKTFFSVDKILSNVHPIVKSDNIFSKFGMSQSNNLAKALSNSLKTKLG